MYANRLRDFGPRIERMKMDERMRAFIREHEGVAPEKVALMGGAHPDWDMRFVAQQVKGQAKAREKLPSWHACEAVVYPPSLALEQCSSEETARFKASLVKGDSALDLTGGFGVDAAVLAERFGRVTYLERDEGLAALVAENVKALGMAAKVKVVTGDGLAYLRSDDRRFDLIYVDPARRDARSLKVSGLQECQPDITACWGELLDRGAKVMVKASPGMDIEAALRQLPGVREVYVVAVGKEVRELLLVAERGWVGEPPVICAMKCPGEPWQRFSFRLSEEKALPGDYGPLGDYLFEPHAAIMKAGGFKSLAREFGLRQVQARTRLMTGERPLENFPGHAYEILDTGRLQSGDARRLFPDGRANVVARNCGLGSEPLKRKLKLGDGGELFAIGLTDWEGKRRLAKARRVG